jgi:putative nucleotidyltransferase with HDIG domain
MDATHLARSTTLALFHELNESASLRRHGYAVEAAMRLAAERTGNDVERWGAVGLLHDLDYERFPHAPDHPLKGAEILRQRGYDEPFVRCVLAHAPYTGEPRDNDCKRWLFAVDELCGFCMACAMVQPERKISAVKVSSVVKKLRRKEFAAKVNREEIHQGAAELGRPLEEVIGLVIEALSRAAADLAVD